MFYINIYLFIELEKLFFKRTFWPSGLYFYLFLNGCSIYTKKNLKKFSV